jgi:hypothetical protein
MKGLQADPTATAGPTNLFFTSNGTVTLTSDYILAFAALSTRGAVIVEPDVTL